MTPRLFGGIALRGAIVALILATGYIHYTLGGLIFTATAAGYLALAVAMVAPIGIAHDLRWLTRLTVMGFAAGTIFAWLMQGHPIFFQSVAAKTVEVALIALVAVEEWVEVGSPTVVARKLVSLGARVVGVRAGAAA
ncbi:MAG: hypothetical protein ACHQ3P_05765 [Candidatus Limnocylindrales bacterium]